VAWGETKTEAELTGAKTDKDLLRFWEVVVISNGFGHYKSGRGITIEILSTEEKQLLS
jgi:hypothetical protein